MTLTKKMPTYRPVGKAAFAIVIEMLEIIGFVIGFYAVVALPAKNMESDLTHIKEGTSWQDSVQFVQDELKILVESSIDSRKLGFIAMVFIVVAFILRTIVSRVIHMPSDL